MTESALEGLRLSSLSFEEGANSGHVTTTHSLKKITTIMETARAELLNSDLIDTWVGQDVVESHTMCEREGGT